jgi:hypothetical protein
VIKPLTFFTSHHLDGLDITYSGLMNNANAKPSHIRGQAVAEATPEKESQNA